MIIPKRCAYTIPNPKPAKPLNQAESGRSTAPIALLRAELGENVVSARPDVALGIVRPRVYERATKVCRLSRRSRKARVYKGGASLHAVSLRMTAESSSSELTSLTLFCLRFMCRQW